MAGPGQQTTQPNCSFWEQMQISCTGFTSISYPFSSVTVASHAFWLLRSTSLLYNVIFLGLVTDILQDYSCNTTTTHTILFWLGTLGGGSSGKQGSSKGGLWLLEGTRVEQNTLLGGTARTKPSDYIYRQREKRIWFMFVSCRTYTISPFCTTPSGSFAYVFMPK